MAAGSFIWNTYSMPAASNSCRDVLDGATSFPAWGGAFIFYGCSADPVQVGTLVYIYNVSSHNSNVTVPVTAITATASSGLSGSMVPDITAADGAALSGAILAIWSIGFAFRSVIRSLNVDKAVPEDK